MSIVSTLKRAGRDAFIPVARLVHGPARRKLAASSAVGRRLSDAVESLSDLRLRGDPAVLAIERLRASLSADHQPLADGTLGEPGPYDGISVSTACESSKPPVPALLLYTLVREFKPRNVIELGTNLGVSGAYIAAGLPAGGKLTTLEASPYRLRIAQKLISQVSRRDVEYVPGMFADTLPSVLERLPLVDMAFIDGHHQYHPTMEYFEQIRKYASDECVFIFDDIRWSQGMLRAWRELQADQGLDVVVDLRHVGIGVASKASARHSAPLQGMIG